MNADEQESERRDFIRNGTHSYPSVRSFVGKQYVEQSQAKNIEDIEKRERENSN